MDWEDLGPTDFVTGDQIPSDLINNDFGIIANDDFVTIGNANQFLYIEEVSGLSTSFIKKSQIVEKVFFLLSNSARSEIASGPFYNLLCEVFNYEIELYTTNKSGNVGIGDVIYVGTSYAEHIANSTTGIGAGRVTFYTIDDESKVATFNSSGVITALTTCHTWNYNLIDSNAILTDTPQVRCFDGNPLSYTESFTYEKIYTSRTNGVIQVGDFVYSSYEDGGTYHDFLSNIVNISVLNQIGFTENGVKYKGTVDANCILSSKEACIPENIINVYVNVGNPTGDAEFTIVADASVDSDININITFIGDLSSATQVCEITLDSGKTGDVIYVPLTEFYAYENVNFEGFYFSPASDASFRYSVNVE